MAKILIYTCNVVGKSMAGPAIRAWEFAKHLGADHQVILVAPNQPDREGEGFTVLSRDNPLLSVHFSSAEVIIAQSLTILLALKIKRYGIKLIIDAYDPLPLECLEIFKEDAMTVQQEKQSSALNQLIFNFKLADGIICASEKQRDLWIGFLLGRKLITPHLYSQDSSMQSFINVVPFGLSPVFPKKNGSGLREKYGLDPQDKILLWGGGIWNWFDPLTLIRAVKLLSQTRSDIKLVFLGIKVPDPTVPQMAMCTQAIELSKELELYEKTVFFNTGWVPYEERHNFLHDATVGVSMHFQHLETRYSFRTRMLDYIWAELPIVATEGDSFADLIQQQDLGVVVPYQDEYALAQAISVLVDDPQRLKQIKSNLQKIRPHFYWNKVVEPIGKMVKQMTGSSKPTKINYQDIKHLVNFLFVHFSDKGFKNSCKLIFNKMNKKLRKINC